MLGQWSRGSSGSDAGKRSSVSQEAIEAVAKLAGVLVPLTLETTWHPTIIQHLKPGTHTLWLRQNNQNPLMQLSQLSSVSSFIKGLWLFEPRPGSTSSLAKQNTVESMNFFNGLDMFFELQELKVQKGWAVNPSLSLFDCNFDGLKKLRCIDIADGIDLDTFLQMASHLPSLREFKSLIITDLSFFRHCEKDSYTPPVPTSSSTNPTSPTYKIPFAKFTTLSIDLRSRPHPQLDIIDLTQIAEGISRVFQSLKWFQISFYIISDEEMENDLPANKLIKVLKMLDCFSIVEVLLLCSFAVDEDRDWNRFEEVYENPVGVVCRDMRLQ
ncbi:hypothetical protein HDU76_010677, partial [Blyttiomyces sp. JEL0837]